MPQGYLIVITTTALGKVVVARANVAVIGNDIDFRYDTATNYEGRTDEIALQTKDKALSLQEQLTEKPYLTYRVIVDRAGFNRYTSREIEIFDDQVSYLNVHLIPSDSAVVMPAQQKFGAPNTVVIPATAVAPTPAPSPFRQKIPFIPSHIAVKLGPPGSNASVVHIPFVDYIKQVASYELYPTWPEESLRANILAIISLALNRIHSNWYRSQGHLFQISNSPVFDQNFVKDHAVYQTIDRIVDDAFNEYIHRVGSVEPIYANYCDGILETCDGLSQWGSVRLALDGLNALEIMKHYFGDDIEISQTKHIEDMVEEYPGRPLQMGSKGHPVYLMQLYLNRIALDYPGLIVIQPVNGIFDRLMKEAVERFQRLFYLEDTGKIDKDTWYKISFMYVGLQELAQLLSEGILHSDDLAAFKSILREGDRGSIVSWMQYALNVISQFIDSVPRVTMNGLFDEQTKNALLAFQQTYGLPETGVADRDTWDMLGSVFERSLHAIPPRDQLYTYPGIPLSEGSSGEAVQILQSYLNRLANEFPYLPKVTADGEFGPRTKAQVMAFQRAHQKEPDGIVDLDTWNTILAEYSQFLTIPLYPGYDIKFGEHNAHVALIQKKLNQLNEQYRLFAPLEVDGIFGIKTRDAVRQAQNALGLDQDGVVNKRTWKRLMEVVFNHSSKVSGDVLLHSVVEAIHERLRREAKKHFK